MPTLYRAQPHSRRRESADRQAALAGVHGTVRSTLSPQRPAAARPPAAWPSTT
ncbi:hypothetical protein [Streptomyces sp. NPDC096339]|uniref:hypothetical protein n=1 Tax=Streptomyces sp. NPDC096339 TaxID=3366086 RepID=UPI0037F33418